MCITVAFWFTIPWSLISGDRVLDGSVSSIKIEKNEIGGACSDYGEKAYTAFWWRDLKESDHLGD